MSIPTVSLNESSPAGSDSLNQGDNRIREYKTQNREILEVDHLYPSTGQNADAGKHKRVSLLSQTDLGTGATSEPILGAQTVGGVAELVFTTASDVDIQLTKGSKLHLDSGRLTNNTNLIARNAADSADINLIKANTLGAVEIPNGAVLSSSSAPTTDPMIPNKKYVDDQIAAVSLEVKQHVYTQTQATSSGGVAVPDDGTIPQNTEGFAMSSLDTAITPTNSSNILVIEGVVNMAGAAGRACLALFQDSGADAKGVYGGIITSANVASVMAYRFVMVAGTTSATTFKLRFGNASGDTFTLNGESGSAKWGGKLTSTMSITEYLP